MNEPLPTFVPGESNINLKLSVKDKSAPFLFLYQSHNKLGHTIGNFTSKEFDLSFFWTSKCIPAEEKTIESNNVPNMNALMELSQIHIKQQNFFDAYLLLQKILRKIHRMNLH
jgi:hypothetical protein